MRDHSNNVKATALLLIAAVVWGFAFVAQRSAMSHLGPFFFTGVRFGLGGLMILPLVIREARSQQSVQTSLSSGILLGCFLFAGISFQQVALLTTSAGNAGFITGMYVVLVPFVGLLMGMSTCWQHWLGVIASGLGVTLLCWDGLHVFNSGDILSFFGACVWAVHVLLVGKLVKRASPFKLAFLQFMTCSVVSLSFAVALEPLSLLGIVHAWKEVAYASFMSVGVGYTLQVVGQQYAHPTHAGILMSFEAVFAMLGGWLFLAEDLGVSRVLGAILMLLAMILSQTYSKKVPLVE